jgi:hypothetical protein
MDTSGAFAAPNVSRAKCIEGANNNDRKEKAARRRLSMAVRTSLMFLQTFTGELPQEVGRLARFAGGGEDGATVLSQKCQ